MKLACQENLVDVPTFAEKLDILECAGYEGVEVWGTDLETRISEINHAMRGRSLRVATVCAGYGGCLLDAAKSERDKAMDDIKRLLGLCADVGASGLIVVPIFGPPKINDLSPYKTALQLEGELLAVELKELAERAQEAGVYVILEPLNRYQTHFLNRLEQATQVCEEIGSPFVKIMADFYHMNIEEASIPDAIRLAKDHLVHVHLSDSNRLPPGCGHVDFAAGFAALSEIGFEGYAALECAGPRLSEDRLRNIRDYVVSQLARARS
ncbi:MAG: sugar phosphate isomerase/epimerase [Bacillota bacterium]